MDEQGPTTLATCLVEPCDEHPAGPHVTGGDGFLPGMTLTLPAGFTSFEHSVGELELHQVADPDARLQIFLWRDLRAVVGVGGPAGPPQIVAGVGGSPEALAAWLEADPRFETSDPIATTLGSGIEAIKIDVTVSADAVNEEPLTEDGGCDPAEIVCIGAFYDPEHWVSPGTAYGMGRLVDLAPGECCQPVYRVHLAQIGTDADPTTLVVALVVNESEAASAIDDWQAMVQPILDSIVIPDQIADN